MASYMDALGGKHTDGREQGIGMTRDEMIEFLSESDFRYITETDGGLELLDSYIQFGFKGYENYTDEELSVEYAQRKEIEENA